MLHELSVRASKEDKKEVIVGLELEDKWGEVEVTESIVACAFKHIIIRCNDAGRSVMKSDDYKNKKLTDEDVKKTVLAKFKAMTTLQKYEFRTKGQAMSKVEKVNKGMADLSEEELANVIAKAQELQKKGK